MRLSICVPVYNCAEFVGAALESILPQLDGDSEIVVVDGASSDATGAIVTQFAARAPALRYVRLPARGGIDADMAASVELARGEYCWLFSGDDVMRPGAVGNLVRWLATSDDVYICRHTICDREMRFLGDYPVFRRDAARAVQFADASERRAYLRDALNTEALFSFMSGITVRRATWLAGRSGFIGSCWGHVARLLSVAQERGLRVRYVGETWLDKRGGNDSFMDRGLVHRLSIAVDGFTSIAAAFYGGDSEESKEVRRLLRHELGLPMFMYARALAAAMPETESHERLARLCEAIYRDPGVWNWVVRQAFRWTPEWTVRGLRSAYRAARSAGIRLRSPPEDGVRARAEAGRGPSE